jgi:hypothetical protein
MSTYRTRTWHVVVACVILGTLTLVDPVAAQERGPADTGVSPLVEAVAAMGFTLVAGGLLVKFARDFTEGFIDTMVENAVSSFLIGLMLSMALGFLVLLSPSLGILPAIPFLIALLVFTPMGYLTVGGLVADSWGGSLLVGVVIAGLATTIPVIGPAGGFVISATSVGAFLVSLWGSGS